LLLAAGGAPVPAASAPDWMRAQALQPMPAHDAKADAVLLYAETVLTVQGEGRMRRVDRRVFRILRPGGESFGIVKAVFDGQSRITGLRGWCIPASGKEYEVKERDAVESAYIGADGGLLVSDERTKLLRIPAATPGNVVGYEVEQDIRPYMPGDEWDFEETVPVREARFVLQLPAGWSYRTTWLNHEPVEAQPGPSGQVQWTVTDLKPVRMEERMPPWRGVHGRLVVLPLPPGREQGLQTWEAIGTWTRELVRDRRVASPEIQRKVAELVAGAATPLARAQALARYVQSDIRYVGIELGIGGWQPHAAPDVYAHHYGDCKDKATLLATMLKEAGVESYYVLVNTQRGSLNAGTPPHLGFNHVILAVRLPDDASDPTLLATAQLPGVGRVVYFDPTNEQTPFGRLSGDLQASYALVIGSDASHYLPLPQLAPTTSGTQRIAKLALHANGDLSGTVSETRSGDDADSLRDLLANVASESDRVRPVESVLAGSLATFQVANPQVRNVQERSLPLESEYTLQVDRYSKANGDLLLVRPRVFGRWASGLLEGDEPRQHAVEMQGPGRDSDVFEIELPPGYVVDDLPPAVNQDCGFAVYRSKSELVGHTLRYSRSLEVRSLSVPVEKALVLRDFYRTISGDERMLAVLRRAGPQDRP
jgi:transglutaminase-like putative cysteine protease